MRTLGSRAQRTLANSVEVAGVALDGRQAIEPAPFAHVTAAGAFEVSTLASKTADDRFALERTCCSQTAPQWVQGCGERWRPASQVQRSSPRQSTVTVCSSPGRVVLPTSYSRLSRLANAISRAPPNAAG